jgi:hypothetical protein
MRDRRFTAKAADTSRRQNLAAPIWVHVFPLVAFTEAV